MNVITYQRKEAISLYSLITVYEIWSPPYPSFDSAGPSDTYMRQENVPPLVKIMASHLFGAKPLF